MYVDIIGMLNQMSDDDIQNWIHSMSKNDIDNLFKTQSQETLRFMFKKFFGESNISEHIDVVKEILNELETIYKDMGKNDLMFQQAIYDIYQESKKEEGDEQSFSYLWKLLGTLMIENKTEFAKLNDEYAVLSQFMLVMQCIKSKEFGYDSDLW